MKKAIKSVFNGKLHMNRWKAIVFAVLATVVVGCGNDKESLEAVKAANGEHSRFANVSFYPTIRGADAFLLQHLHENKGKLSSDSLYELLSETRYMGKEDVLKNPWLAKEFIDTAYAKRKTALIMGRSFFSYKFANYFYLDGVSGFTYNLSYIFSIPRKAFLKLRYADSILDFLIGLFVLVLGFVFSVVGLVFSTILGFICHPLESLSNLLIGVAYFGEGGFQAWKIYVWHTNLLASLWDIVWGAIIYPLWQAVVFWV